MKAKQTEDSKPLSIPESKLLVRKLRRDEDHASAANKIPQDYFHGMKIADVVDHLINSGINVGTEYVATAIRDVIKV